MNKIISINIGGLVFQIEDEAYERLEKYLVSIKRRFGNTEGSDEIVTDIEARIAEMLKEKMDAGAPSVTLTHIEEVIAVMGNPSEIGGEDMGDEAEEEPNTGNNYRTGKRLYRDTDDKVISGVCSGLGLYFGLEPVWIRAAFAISFFMFGTGALLYLILWGIIPEAKTSADKLRMRGEKINIDNLEKRIREEMEKVQEAFTGKSGKKKVATATNTFSETVKDIAQVFFKIFGKVIGIFFVIIGLSILTVMVVGALHLSSDISFPLSKMLPLFYENNWEYILAISALATVILIPLIMVTIKGVMLLVGVRRLGPEVRATAGSLWVLGFIVGIVMLVSTLLNFADEATVYDTTEIAANDTIIVSGMVEKSYARYDYRINRLVSIDGILQNANVRFTIEPSNNGKIELETVKSARGKNYERATEYAKNIEDKVTIKGNELIFANTFSTVPEKLYREQEVKYILRIPVGTTIILNNSIKEILYDVDNVHNMLDRNMVGKTWVMKAEGLTCTNCTESVIENDLTAKEYVKSFNYEHFNRIKIEESFKVNIQYGNTFSVKLAGEHEWVERTEVEKSGGTLRIDMDRNFFEKQTDEEVVEVYITLPRLDYLDVSGASEVAMDGFNQHQMKLEVNGASSLIASINSEILYLDLSGASKADIRGEGNRLNLDLSGSCVAKCSNFKTEVVNADLSGASNAEVYATNTISGDVSGASELKYKGTPSLRVDNDIAGSTRKID